MPMLARKSWNTSWDFASSACCLKRRRALANIAIFVDLFAAVPSTAASAPAPSPAAPANAMSAGVAPSAPSGGIGALVAAPGPAASPAHRRLLAAATPAKQQPYVDLGITFDFFKSLQLPVDAPVRRCNLTAGVWSVQWAGRVEHDLTSWWSQAALDKHFMALLIGVFHDFMQGWEPFVPQMQKELKKAGVPAESVTVMSGGVLGPCMTALMIMGITLKDHAPQQTSPVIRCFSFCRPVQHG